VDRDERIAWALHAALKKAGRRGGRRPYVEEPAKDETSVIDGSFDLYLAATELEKALHGAGFEIVVTASKDA
jgi:hypothetical protein